MELSAVKGLGPTKIEKLKAVGIADGEALAEVDLRTLPEIPGVSRENLKALKKRARQACDKAGVAYAKAPYDAKTVAKGPGKPAKEGKPEARGFVARLFRRA